MLKDTLLIAATIMRRACNYLMKQIVHDFGKIGVTISRNKSSHCRNEKLTSLKKWHDVVAAIPTSQILPTGFGNKSGTAVTEAAWYGDKLIGEQVALQLHKFSMNEVIASDGQKLKNIRHGMHMLHGVAVSNKLFADELKVILPSHAPKNVAIASQKKVHDAGTMIEAAVYAVSSLSASKKHEALATLAKFLIVKAAQGKETLPREMSEKLLNFMKADYFDCGKQKANSILQTNVRINDEISEESALLVLNKYGGKVDCMDLKNQHPPKFRATAELNGTFVSSEASRKKAAKRHAAYTLLKKMKKANKKKLRL